MRTPKKATTAAVLTGALAAGALGTAAPAAATTAAGPDQGREIVIQGNCGDSESPSVGGGAAGWDISCSGGKIRVQGWVKDTDEDGKAAEVYGTWSGGDRFKTARAGGSGTVKKFDQAHKGNHVKLQLRVV